MRRAILGILPLRFPLILQWRNSSSKHGPSSHNLSDAFASIINPSNWVSLYPKRAFNDTEMICKKRGSNNGSPYLTPLRFYWCAARLFPAAIEILGLVGLYLTSNFTSSYNVATYWFCEATRATIAGFRRAKSFWVNKRCKKVFLPLSLQVVENIEYSVGIGFDPHRPYQPSHY